MNKFFNLKTLAVVLLLASCSKESPELIPCMCDGTESTLGLFDCMCEPLKKKPVKKFSYIQDTVKPRYQTIIINEEQEDAYLYLHQRRDSFAPVKLEYVDFRIKKNGDYENYIQVFCVKKIHTPKRRSFPFRCHIPISYP